MYIFSHPDFTVGQGISPCRHYALSIMFADFTAGTEFHRPQRYYNFIL